MKLILYTMAVLAQFALLLSASESAAEDASEHASMPFDTVALATRPPLGLPPLGLPPLKQDHDPVTAAKVSLGRKLFVDRRLSFNATLSCAMCHIPEQGFTHNELATPVGFEGQSVKRNAPALYNVVYRRRLFYDGRENDLEHQAWSPLLAPNEMANPSIGSVLERIRALPDYTRGFIDAFGEGPTMTNLGRAFAAYQRTLLDAASPFDRWHFGGEADAMSASAARGFELFVSKGCSGCHLIAADHAHFTDDEFHNTGIGYHAAQQKGRSVSRMQVAPGVVIDVRAAVAVPVPNDGGRYEATRDPADLWKFRTPSLRNVALTAPYMHDGSLATLDRVIDHYNGGGVPHDGLDPLIRPLDLAQHERNDLRVFLESLTGSYTKALAADARSAPVGDTGLSP